MKMFWSICLIIFNIHSSKIFGANILEYGTSSADISKLNIQPFSLTNSSIDDVKLFMLNLGIMCCDEDFAASDKAAFNSLSINLCFSNTQNLAIILTRLHEQSPSINWYCDDGILILRASDLSKLQDNPLDSKLRPFKFKGNLIQLIAFISSEMPDLSPSYNMVGWPGDDSEVYNFDFPSETTIRSVLIRLARDYGVSWAVRIDESQNRIKPASKLYFAFGRAHPLGWPYKYIVDNRHLQHIN